MSVAEMNSNPVGCDLESVIATGDLKRRTSRTPDWSAETQAEVELTQQLAKAPREFFQKLVDMVLKLSLADSAGISLLDETRGASSGLPSRAVCLLI